MFGVGAQVGGTGGAHFIGGGGGAHIEPGWLPPGGGGTMPMNSG
jgi:hypothetical protein